MRHKEVGTYVCFDCGKPFQALYKRKRCPECEKKENTLICERCGKPFGTKKGTYKTRFCLDCRRIINGENGRMQKTKRTVKNKKTAKFTLDDVALVRKQLDLPPGDYNKIIRMLETGEITIRYGKVERHEKTKSLIDL